MAQNPYDILGVSKDASADDIKKAYRNMSRQWHPDKHKGDKAAEDKFKEINQAYEILSNPEKKKMYDQFGTTGGPGGGGPGGGFGGFDFSGFGGNADFGDIFENFFGGGGGGRRAADTARGHDREIQVSIDFADVVTGKKATVSLKRLSLCSVCSGNGAEPGTEIVTCPTCNGTGQTVRTVNSFFGQIQQRAMCGTCEGSGKVPKTPCKKCDGQGRTAEQEEVMIDVPAGIDNGQTLRIRGAGDAGMRNAGNGDLFVHVHVLSDKRFERDGADVRSEISIPVIDAILGASATVETVHGESTVSIPEGMQPSQTFRLKGKGFPVLGSSRTGDHYVTVHIEIPKKLSRKERKVLEEWREAQER